MTNCIGPTHTGQAHPTEAPQVRAAHNLDTLPAALLEVALVDGPTAAATGDVSLSTWHEVVRTGDAPPPVIRSPRCTRWRLVDVAEYWRQRAERGDVQAAHRVTQQAAKASAAAKAKRTAVGA